MLIVLGIAVICAVAFVAVTYDGSNEYHWK